MKTLPVAPNPPVAEAAALTGIRLLLAEDNEINQIIAVRLLKKAGAQVAVVSNGREATERLPLGLDGNLFDLALLDVQMPELDGCETARWIRADARFQSLPIIAFTAGITPEERQRCLDAGMNDHVTKPINLGDLLATLQRWLPHRLQATSPPVAGPAEPESPPLVLPKLPGLDVAAGLQRAGGDSRLYRDLLARYAAGQRDAPARIRAALIAGDRHIAERLAHTLKGVSGNIGAVTIQTLAADLEQALQQGIPLETLAAPLDQIGAALDRLIAGFSAKLPAESVAAPTTTMARVALTAIVQRLESLLCDDDTEAVDWFAGHREQLAGSLDAERFQSLAQAISDYDFAEALRHLTAFQFLEDDRP
jgi:CheY-like chemotaxis protein/HPt (histidine-containing phosphotransfer) domain-containing protein